jgi:hypothetical protein
VRYTIKHTLNTTVDTFWKKIFFDPEYNEKLFKDRLKFDVYKVLALEHKPDGSVYRKIDCAPPIEMPSIAKKFFGDSTGYIETGLYDPKTGRFNTDIQPKAGADKIQMRVSIWAEPRGDKQIERFVDVEGSVKIFGIGKIVEGMLESNTRESYDIAADFTNKWVVEKAL